VDGWRRREIGISGVGSLRRPRHTQGCSAEEEKKKKKKRKRRKRRRRRRRI